MSFNRAQFLIGVLGADASLALAKAASRSEYLSQMIMPRTILALLEAVPAFTGTVPGFEECSLTYAKSENGFTGNVTVGEDFYKFENANIFHVAGALATAMSLDSLMFGNARIPELQRLGKTIDMMAKAHLVGEELSKALPGPNGPQIIAQHMARLGPTHKYYQASANAIAATKAANASGSSEDHLEASQAHHMAAGVYAKHNQPEFASAVAAHQAGQREHAQVAQKQAALGKGEWAMAKKAMGEGAGKNAGPVAPAAPVAPTANAGPATTQQKLPKAPASAQLPKPPKPATSSTVKLTRSEKTRACPVCSVRQFSADDKFVGCLCFRALAKHVDVTDHGEYSELRLGEDWDRETVVTFLEAVGRR